MDSGPKRIGIDGWKSLPVMFRNGVSAVLHHLSNDRVYSFRGNRYCRWKPGEGVDFGPAPIATYWPGVMF